MIHLFFGNNEVELSEDISFALTQEFEDIEKLTNIKNTWSKTINIPASASNNRLFGILNVDSDIAHLTDALYGRYDFNLRNDSNVVMIGYAQLNNLTMEGQFGYYEFNLYGELGNVLLEAQNFTFNKDEYTNKTDIENYYIDGSKYFKDKINASLVWKCWHQGRKEDSVIGWAPNNAFSSNFDYKTYEQIEDDQAKTYTFQQTLEGREIEKYTNVPAETIVGNGLLPRQIGEFRSYHQIPYIYFPKLMQIFVDKLGVNKKTKDYKVILDEGWFNENNPYYYDQVMLLKGLHLKDSDKSSDNSNNKYVGPYFKSGQEGKNRIGSWLDGEQVDWTYAVSRDLIFFQWTESKPIYKDGVFTRDPSITERYSFSFDFNVGNTAGLTNLSDNNNLDVHIWLADADTGEKVKEYYYIMSSALPEATTKDFIIQELATKFTLSNTFLFKIGELPTKTKLRLCISCGWSAQRRPFKPITQDNGTVFVDLLDTSVLGVNIDNTILSDKTITLADLWDYDYTLYDKIIEYCKIFHILIDVDSFNKTITFKQFKKYFSESPLFSGEIEDWSDKIDYSKEWSINPFVWNYKYLKFNYDQPDTKIGNEYKSNTGYNYGELRLNTSYNYNNETNDMFNGVKNTIELNEQVLNWDTLYNLRSIIYTVPKEITLFSRNDSDEFVNCFGQWAFYNGLKSFDMDLKQPKITDDTDLQLATNTYFYGQDVAPGLLATTFPSLRIKKGTYIDLFTTPIINYTIEDYTGSKGIYDNIWSNYCSERFGRNNKILTCYINLSLIDYQNWKPNKFVKVGNQLYIVNKIIDYDPSTHQSTKCELLTVQDPNNYTK